MIYLLFFFQLFFRLLLQAFLLRMEEAEQATVQLTQRYTELQAECELSRAQLDIERSEARRMVRQIRSQAEAQLEMERSQSQAAIAAMRATCNSQADALKLIKQVGLLLAAIAIAIFFYFCLIK